MAPLPGVPTHLLVPILHWRGLIITSEMLMTKSRIPWFRPPTKSRIPWFRPPTKSRIPWYRPHGLPAARSCCPLQFWGSPLWHPVSLVAAKLNDRGELEIHPRIPSCVVDWIGNSRRSHSHVQHNWSRRQLHCIGFWTTEETLIHLMILGIIVFD